MGEDMNEHLPEDVEEDSLGFTALVSSSHGGGPVVRVRGEIDLATIPRLLEAIGIAGSRMDGQPLAFVDLRPVRFIDVYGVRKLVEEVRAMRELGGDLRLVIPEEGPVAHVFELLQVEQVLELYHELAASEVRRYQAGWDQAGVRHE